MQCCNNEDCNEKGHICIPESKAPRVVVIGGGFAGLKLVEKLKNKNVQVVLIDKNNFHQFVPLLYQVATSGIEPDNIVFPFRRILSRQSNVVFRMAEATGIDMDNNQLNTSIGSVPYDYLVLAQGSVVNFFGNKSFEWGGQGLKSITDALDIRSLVLQNLERAAVTCTTHEKSVLSTIVIVGAGPAGVEMAGAFAEFKKYIIPNDYPELLTTGMTIYLIEAGDRLLPAMPGKLSEKTLRYLNDLNVEILLNVKVKSYHGSVASLDNGQVINAANFIWTAGIKGSSVNGLPSAVYNRQNRIWVDEFNRVAQAKNIFAIGDIACMVNDKFPNGHPMVAQVAIQQGRLLAKNIVRLINNKDIESFDYHDKGTMATIGKQKAVAFIGNRSFGGRIAWVLWSAVHLMSIIGVRNKLLIAVNWFWNYLTYDKGDRVIIRKYSRKGDLKKGVNHE